MAHLVPNLSASSPPRAAQTSLQELLPKKRDHIALVAGPIAYAYAVRFTASGQNVNYTLSFNTPRMDFTATN